MTLNLVIVSKFNITVYVKGIKIKCIIVYVEIVFNFRLNLIL